MRKAVLFFACYLARWVQSSMYSTVEGSRTRAGIIMVSRYLFFLSLVFPVVAFHLLFSTFAPLRLVVIDHCSLFCSLSFAAIPHCFSSLLFVTKLVAQSRSLSVCSGSRIYLLLGSGSGAETRSGRVPWNVYRISCIFVLKKTSPLMLKNKKST